MADEADTDLRGFLKRIKYGVTGIPPIINEETILKNLQIIQKK